MSINIPLTENWRIKTDRNNWILTREEGNRDHHEGFYRTLEGAVQGFVRMKVKGFNSTSILALENSIKALEKRLFKLIQDTGVREKVK